MKTRDIIIKTILRDGQAVGVIDRPRFREDVPSFICIGVNMDFETREAQFPNLLKTLQNLSKSGTWFFWALIETRNVKTNICFYRPKTSAEIKRISRAYKELSELGMVKRVNNTQYLLHPKIAIPEKGNYRDAIEIWRLKNNDV